MQRQLITVPASLFKPTDFSWDIDFRSAKLDQDLDGGDEVQLSSFPRWIGSPTLVLSDHEIAAFRAIRWHAMGRAGVYRIRMFDPIMAVPLGPDNGVPFSTGERFSTGKGFAFDPFYTCTKAASIGADVLRVSVPADGPAPRPGQIVSDQSDWPIGITSVTQVSGTQYDLTVKPNLRAAIASGDQISMEATGRFVSLGDTVGNPSFGTSLVSRPKLEFREYLLR